MSPAVRKAATMSIISAGILIPPAFFYYMVVKFSPNIPYNDDYDAILGFLIQYLDAGGISERLSLIFAQHNEHRIAFGKVFTVVHYYATGAIDFRVVTFFGNLSLLCITFVFFRMFRAEKEKLLLFIPVVLVFFQFQYSETIVWPMASVSNFYVLLFAFGSLLLLRGQGWGCLIAAFLLAALSAVTQGSGLFAFPAGALLLLIKKDFGKLAAWAALSAVVLGLYFGAYVTPPHHPSITRVLFEEPLVAIRFFLTLTGASFPFPLLAGILFSMFFLLLTVRGYFKTNPVVYCCLIFAFMTTAATSVTRSGFGIEQSLISRYRIVSVLFPVLSYMAIAELFKQSAFKRLVFPIMLSGALVFNIVSNAVYYEYFLIYNKELRSGLLKWNYGAPALHYPDQDRAGRILSESIKRGLYRPELE